MQDELKANQMKQTELKEFSGQVHEGGATLIHKEPFRVSSGLKDLIGRDLITMILLLYLNWSKTLLMPMQR